MIPLPYSTIANVYFAQVRGGGPIKIGASADHMKRIKSLASWCPFPLDFIASVKACTLTEKVLHDIQIDHCIHHEWFEPNEALLAIIEHVKAHKKLPASIIEERDRRWAAICAKRDEYERRETLRRQGKLPPARTRPGYNPIKGAALRSLRKKRKATAERKKAAAGRLRKINYEQALASAVAAATAE